MQTVTPSDGTTMRELARSIVKSKKIIVLTGAGISTSCGIPDFRSKTGLYSPSTSSSTSTSKTKASPALFSASSYSSTSSRTTHLRFMSHLHEMTSTVVPSPTHRFFETLKTKGKLKRVYTQNIDALELKTGLKEARVLEKEGKGKGKAKEIVEGDVVQLHGTLERVRCTTCTYSAGWDSSHSTAFDEGEVPECPLCEERAKAREAAGKRYIPSQAHLRPSILLYDETPTISLSTLIDATTSLDLSSPPDVVLVMGTTLKIPGFKSLVKTFSMAAKKKGGKSVFVNLEKAGKEWQSVFDTQVVGKCDDFVEVVMKEWRSIRPQDFELQPRLAFNQILKQGMVTAKEKEKRIPLSPLRANSLPSSPPFSLASKKRTRDSSPCPDSTSLVSKSKKVARILDYSSPRSTPNTPPEPISAPLKTDVEKSEKEEGSPTLTKRRKLGEPYVLITTPSRRITR